MESHIESSPTGLPVGGPIDVEGASVALRATEPRCANCGASAPGTYCPDCGQPTRERLPTFVEFMREASGRYVALDGKLWKTLIALLFRPGFLTREYLAGRRRRYIGPARLFLVSSLVVFAVLRFASESLVVDDVFRSDGPVSEKGSAHEKGSAAAPDRQSDPPRRTSGGEKVALDDDFNVDVGDLLATTPLAKRIERFNRLSRTQKIEQIVAGLLRYGPYAMFVLLPAFALLLKLVYMGRRRRHPKRPRLYGEHLVFAAHNHAFVFAWLALLLALPAGIVRKLAAVWVLVYLLWSQRAVYGGSWLGIVGRAALTVPVYTVLFGMMTAALVIAAVLLS